MKNLKINKSEIKKIYEVSYKVSESTGKARQHIINQVVIDGLIGQSEYTGCKFIQEYSLKKKEITWGARFPVDIAIFKDDVLIEIILIKAPASNISQNNINNISKINSDIDRLSKLNNIKITIVNFVLNIPPYFKSNESISKFEKAKVFFITNVYNDPSNNLSKKFNIDEVNISFDIENIQNCKHKTDVRELFEKSNPITNVKIEEQNYIKK
jgi:hypothetical protein